MSGDDLLTRATQALREASEVSPADAAATRVRIMATLRTRERSRGRLLVLVLPIAAMLATGTALGRNGSALRGWWEQISERLVGSSSGDGSPAHGQASLRAPATALAVEPEPATPAPPEPATPAPPEPATPGPATPEPERAPAPVPSPAPARPAPLPPRAHTPAPRVPTAAVAPVDSLADGGEAPPSADVEAIALERYRLAHRRHFVEQNYAAALVAWDDYLQYAPSGKLAIDARYNRAIALLRLNRRSEAVMALSPFARGEVGAGYRREQARALLSAIAESDAGRR